MHLVNDVDLVFADGGQIGNLIAQVADIVNAVIGGGVHLNDIHNCAGVNALADFALAARVGAGSVQTVDRLGKDFGTGCLAGAAGAGKQVGVANAPGGNLVLQRRDDGGLPYNVSKALGTPFAV